MEHGELRRPRGERRRERQREVLEWPKWRACLELRVPWPVEQNRTERVAGRVVARSAARVYGNDQGYLDGYGAE